MKRKHSTNIFLCSNVWRSTPMFDQKLVVYEWRRRYMSIYNCGKRLYSNNKDKTYTSRGSGASYVSIQYGWPDRLHWTAFCLPAILLNVTIPVPQKNSDSSPKNLFLTLLGRSRVYRLCNPNWPGLLDSLSRLCDWAATRLSCLDFKRVSTMLMYSLSANSSASLILLV